GGAAGRRRRRRAPASSRPPRSRAAPGTGSRRPPRRSRRRGSPWGAREPTAPAGSRPAPAGACVPCVRGRSSPTRRCARPTSARRPERGATRAGGRRAGGARGRTRTARNRRSSAACGRRTGAWTSCAPVGVRSRHHRDAPARPPATPAARNRCGVRRTGGARGDRLVPMARRAPLSPGDPTPVRSVPKEIQRPEYAWKPTAREGREPWVQDAETIEAMRTASKIAAGALAEAGAAVEPGVSTDELDRIAHEYMCEHGAYPSTLGYRGFTKSCCTSLNEVICHGIPDTTVFGDGDIVHIDVTAFIHGVHGDTNATFLAGDVDEEARLLVERTREATLRAVKAFKPGRALNIIGRVIESYANRFGYGVVRDFTGHGVGPTFHN